MSVRVGSIIQKNHWSVLTAIVALLTGLLIGTGEGALGAGLALIYVLFLLGLRVPLVVVSIALVIGGLPLSHFTGGAKSLLLSLGGVNLSGLWLVGVVVPLTVYVMSRRAMLEKGRRHVPYVILLALGLLSLLYSPSKLEGLRLLFKLAYPFLVFTVILSTIKKQESLSSLSHMILFGGLLAAAVSVVKLALGQGLHISGTLRFMGAGFYSTSSFFNLTLSVLCYAIFAYSREKRQKVLYFMLFLLFASQAVLSLMRITSVALAISVPLLELIRGRKRLAFFLLLCLVVFFAVFSPLQQRMTFEGRATFLSEPPDWSSPSSVLSRLNTQGRDRLWSEVWSSLDQQHLLFGHGLGASTKLLQERFSTQSIVVHNDYLRLLYDVGVIGLMLFVVAYLGLIRKCWTINKNAAGSQTRAFASAGVASLTAFLIITVTDNTLDYYGVFAVYVWAIAAMALLSNELGESETLQTVQLPGNRLRRMWSLGAGNPQASREMK